MAPYPGSDSFPSAALFPADSVNAAALDASGTLTATSSAISFGSGALSASGTLTAIGLAITPYSGTGILRDNSGLLVTAGSGVLR